MRHTLVVGLIVVATVFPLHVGAQQTWLCISEQSGGVRYDPSTRKWVSSVFRSDDKYIINPYDDKKRPIGCLTEGCPENKYTVAPMNRPNALFPCRTYGDQDFQISCDALYFDFSMNKKSGRFTAYYRGNFNDARENEQNSVGIYYRDSPAVVIGNCTIVSNNLNIGSGPNIRTIQQRLSDLGLYRGVIDGITGPGTRSAIQQFQRQNSLPATGDLDDRTMRLMFP